MSGQLDHLYKVQKKDLMKAGIVLADAFQHDPIWLRVFENETENFQKMGGFFEIEVRYCFRYGEVYATSEYLEGVAVWVPGDKAEMTPWRMILSGAISPVMRMGLTIAQNAQKAKFIFDPLEVDRRAHMKGRSYIFLMIIGVASQFQGQGFGGKLLRALIEKSDQTGICLYLETETEGNVRMYESFGFKVVNQVTLPVINLPLWEMTREPAS